MVGAFRPRAALLIAVLCALLLSCGQREHSNPFDPANPATRGGPSGFAAVALNGKVELHWTPVSLNGLAGFNAYRRGGGTQGFVLLDGSPFPAASGLAVDSTVFNGSTYEYRIVPLIEGYGEGVSSATLLATPGPDIIVFGDACNGLVSRLSADARAYAWRRGGFYYPVSFATDGERLWFGDLYGGVFCLSDDGSLVWSNKEFALPVSVAVREDGVSAVADVATASVGIISSEGNTIRSIKDGLEYPASVGFDSAGNVWVADRTGGTVRKYSDQGLLLASSSVCAEPRFVATELPGDACWVADVGTGDLVKLDSGAHEILRLAISRRMGALRAAPEGGCWVGDSEKGQLIRVSGEGEVIYRVGKMGSPASIFASQGGKIWVADLGGRRILILSEAGELLAVAASGQCPASIVVLGE